MSNQQTPRPPDEDEPIQPPIMPAMPGEEDEIPDRPWLRRTAIIIYVSVVLCVVIGLVALSFPWGDLDIPFDPPFRFRERI